MTYCFSNKSQHLLDRALILQEKHCVFEISYNIEDKKTNGKVLVFEQSPQWI